MVSFQWYRYHLYGLQGMNRQYPIDSSGIDQFSSLSISKIVQAYDDKLKILKDPMTMN